MQVGSGPGPVSIVISTIAEAEHLLEYLCQCKRDDRSLSVSRSGLWKYPSNPPCSPQNLTRCVVGTLWHSAASIPGPASGRTGSSFRTRQHQRTNRSSWATGCIASSQRGCWIHNRPVCQGRYWIPSSRSEDKLLGIRSAGRHASKPCRTGRMG